ncbi:MAG: CBS domain-containing protein [Planctomycetes bacterium]|nr:CBS domain-containing protein [Planctomycetota bacterium]
MLVRHFMTRHVVTLKEGLRCREALQMFKEKQIRRAPVVRGDKVVGMISLVDLLRILPGSVGELNTRSGMVNEASIVGQVMSTRLVTLHPEEHLEDAARKMLSHKIGGMPVLLDGKLEGVLTESDIFRAFVGMTDSSGELRITFALQSGRKEAPDPILIALRLSFHVRGYLVHERPGGEELAILRLTGHKKDELVEALVQSGYAVIEIVDAQPGASDRPAA